MISHEQLVELAASWLRKRCPIVVTQLATTGEEPDAIGWHGSFSTLIECKSSLEDFRADAKKHFRRFAELGIGQHRFFLTEAGLIKPQLVPDGWGLLEITGKKIRQVRESHLFEADGRHEIRILLSCLRRIGQTAPKGISIRCYTIETKDRATIGIEPEKKKEGA